MPITPKSILPPRQLPAVATGAIVLCRCRLCLCTHPPGPDRRRGDIRNLCRGPDGHGGVPRRQFERGAGHRRCVGERSRGAAVVV